jgi:hypothetical protein
LRQLSAQQEKDGVWLLNEKFDNSKRFQNVF